MYSQLTQTMIKKSFKCFQGTGLSFSINLSLEDIEDDETQELLFSAIHEYAVNSQLTIEILENQVLTDNSRVFGFINKIKSLGVKIAIDDFGSGYANYTHLAKLNADILKIDGSLIKHMDNDLVTDAVIDSIMAFANQLKMQVVAEFVSDKTIFEKVKAKNIGYSQGFYLGKPSEHIE